MKTITFSINPISFLLGLLTMGGLLLLLNFTPPHKTHSGVDSPGVDSPGVDSPDPTHIDSRRFQVVVGQTETVILDTQTGRFVLSPKYIGQPRWVKGDFEELQSREKK